MTNTAKGEWGYTEPSPRPHPPGTLAAAARLVHRHARDPQDEAGILAALGIDP